MAAFEGFKWDSATMGVGATVTWSFGAVTFATLSQQYSGYQAFDSGIGSQYRATIQAAFDAWEAVANIDFTLVEDAASVNLRLGNKYIDGSASPGQGSILATTYFWGGGSGVLRAAQIVFDGDAYNGSNLYWTALHEIGHAIGLGHSEVSSAVMYFMRTGSSSGGLTADDIGGARTLYGAPVAGGGGGSYAALSDAFGFILRIDPESSAATRTVITLGDGSTVPNPTYAQVQTLNTLVAQVDQGQLSFDVALARVVDMADASTSVATLSYQFFTGRTPTQGGLDYLVHSLGNANDLSDAYYGRFNLENRYINFAVNLGKLGEGRAAFQAEYGGLSLRDTVAKAYAEIFGVTATSAKVSAILDATVNTGVQSMTRAQYFALYGQDGANGIGTKAAAVGFLLAEAAKGDTGPLALANEQFLTDLADGSAQYNVDLTIAYDGVANLVTLAGSAEPDGEGHPVWGYSQG